MYKRALKSVIEQKMGKGKAIILIGPRQVGKTTLITEILSTRPHLFLDCDDPKVRGLLTDVNTEEIRSIIGNHKLIFIDEAQRIEGIGMTMKIITDQFKQVQLLVSGSSSFDLSNQINEPLTGRKWDYELLPISWEEYENHHGRLQAEQNLENRLLYGFYPDVLNHPGEEREILKNLVNSYLYKDILSYSGLRKPEVLEKLVQALALQVGNEVAYNELSQIVGVDKNTISNYIDELEKAYIVFKLSSYSNNLRNEIKSNKKIYFYDNGVRNMVIGNFTSLNLRTDKGALWENFLMSERVKCNRYSGSLAKMYFWRTRQQQEVDLVEVNDGRVSGFEFKWGKRGKSKLPRTFLDAYSAESNIIDRKNFRQLITSK